MSFDGPLYSVFVGKYSRSLNSPPFFMILDLFKSNIMLFKGPKEMRGEGVHDLEIFYISCFGNDKEWNSNLISVAQQ